MIYTPKNLVYKAYFLLIVQLYRTSIYQYKELEDFIEFVPCNIVRPEDKFSLNIGGKREDSKTSLVLQRSDFAQFIKFGYTSAGSLSIKNELESITYPRELFGIYDELRTFSYKGKLGYVTRYIECTKGERINPDDVFEIFKKLSQKRSQLDSDMYLSHGDAAPWNFINSKNKGLILVDWEYCGYRLFGYDLIYFFSIQKILDSRDLQYIVFTLISNEYIRSFFKGYSDLKLEEYCRKIVNQIIIETKRKSPN